MTLLYLKNTFGKLHHNLVYKVLDYDHIPDHIKSLTEAFIPIFKLPNFIPEQFNAAFINVSPGILQGGCLSTLLHVQHVI